MQKWEYLVVRTFSGVVMLANGQEVGTMTSGQPIGQMLYEFLAERGDGGWEVVGIGGCSGRAVGLCGGRVFFGGAANYKERRGTSYI